jgi:hypothetical protein
MMSPSHAVLRFMEAKCEVASARQRRTSQVQEDAIEHMPTRVGAFTGPCATLRLGPSVSSLEWTAANERYRRPVTSLLVLRSWSPACSFFPKDEIAQRVTATFP